MSAQNIQNGDFTIRDYLINFAISLVSLGLSFSVVTPAIERFQARKKAKP